MSTRITAIRRNSDRLAEIQPASDWLPNLKNKGLPDVVVDSFRRTHEALQRTQEQLETANKQIATLQRTMTNDQNSQAVLTSFIEMSLGSPSEGGAVRFRVGRGSPEGVIEGSAFKDVWYRLDAAGITTFMFVKTSGEGKTGWTAAAL